MVEGKCVGMSCYGYMKPFRGESVFVIEIEGDIKRNIGICQ